MSASETAIPRHLLGRSLTSITLPLGILMLVAMMVLPLPAFLLDIFFTLNIFMSLLILMVALHTYRPLDFHLFPASFWLQRCCDWR